jgi:hypothetical protein
MNTGQFKKTHGLTKHPLYRVWRSIINRCYDKKTPAYPDYGGRGIKMCDEWRANFKSFYDWAMNNGWIKGLQFDRFPDNNGDYEPSNCRITTPKQNYRNRRSSLMIEIEGVTACLAEWAENKKTPANTIRNRYLSGIRGEALFSKENRTKKLTNEQVIEIYNSKEPAKPLADKYSVSPILIYQIWEGVVRVNITKDQPKRPKSYSNQTII